MGNPNGGGLSASEMGDGEVIVYSPENHKAWVRSDCAIPEDEWR